MDKKTFTAEESCERLDVLLSSALGLTRSAAKKLIDEGNVLLCGAPAKASHAVAKGDEICATIPDPQTLDDVLDADAQARAKAREIAAKLMA